MKRTLLLLKHSFPYLTSWGNSEKSLHNKRVRSNSIVFVALKFYNRTLSVMDEIPRYVDEYEIFLLGFFIYAFFFWTPYVMLQLYESTMND